MKRKTIEKIPYLGAEPCSGEEVRYVAAIALKTLAGEEHLILEIYEKEKLVVPLYRFVYTGKDFGYYCPENETWHAASIMDIFGHVRWHVDHRGDTGQITYISEKDHDRLICFCAAYNCNFYAYNHWWKYLKRLEERILDNKRNQQWQKRQEALGIRCRNMPVLPEHFEKWYRETLFAGTNYLYYRRKRGSAEFYCSCCGISYTCKTRRFDSFEGQFESVLEVPENGKAGKCRSCGAFGIYKPAGRMKTVYGITRTCYVGQAYKGKGAVIRYFSIEKFLHPDSPATFIVTEIARRFFEQGARKSHTDYYLHNGWNGRDEWCDQKNGVPVILKPARVYPGTYAELAGTILQYSGLKEYTLKKLEVPAADYMEKYLQCPYLELISKAGLSKLVDSLVTYDALNILVNPRARNPADKLGIRKEKMGLLVKHSGSNEMLRILKTEKAYGNWTDRQCEEAAELFPDLRQLKTALEHMSIQQFLNRALKYAGASFETAGTCSGALDRLKHACTTYLDYLQMCRDAGYDLDNSVYACPRNLEERHREMVYEINKKERNKRIQESEKRYPDIKKRFKRLRDIYFYEDDSLLIRPVSSAGEMIMEGSELHHCVGGDTYLRKHNEGNSAILLLRGRNMPETPYITVEIKGTKILQWYGKNDKKTDKEYIDKWLDAYVEWLESRELDNAVWQQAVISA